MADAKSADDGRFRVDSRVEIVYILRALMKSNALVTAYFNGGREFVVTAVLQVDSEQGFVVLDSGSNRELNERLLHGREVSVVSSQDGIRVQCSADRVAAVSFEGRLAFRLPLPATIMKLQRREYYRLATPVAHPLKCDIPGPHGKRLELALADISLGGVCLVGQPAGMSFEPGMALEDCRIELPEIGAIRAGLCVRNSYVITLKNGVTSHRTGCEFVKLGSPQEAMVQRYIIRLERERRAKSVDAG
jgi:c-di-GMP-binding flagellar brake protein YcgR